MKYVIFFYMTTSLRYCVLGHSIVSSFKIWGVENLFYSIHRFFVTIGALVLAGILFFIGYSLLKTAKENNHVVMLVFACFFLLWSVILLSISLVSITINLLQTLY